MVAAAWARGFVWGFIARSDHLSTHRSYVIVCAEDATEEGCDDAIKQRRTCGATDKTLAEVRIGDAYWGATSALRVKSRQSRR